MNKPTIALYKHHPECSLNSCNGIVKSLSQDYDVKYFYDTEAKELERILETAKVIAIPGGIGDADKYFELFKRRAANVVADFVEQGGHYLGICMGAYWAGSHFFDILDEVDAVQYIKRSTSDISRSYGTTAPVTWQGRRQNMFFYDGCALIGDESKFTTVARYANGDPMAIIQNRIGLIGCHPESQISWYEKHRYIRQHWHHGYHNNLLLDFVNRLTQSEALVSYPITFHNTHLTAPVLELNDLRYS